MQKTTILRPSGCYGIGLHSGKKIQLMVSPAPEGTGIVFVRTDVKNVNNIVRLSYKNVTATTLCTMIENSSGVKVATVEHLAAAIWGCGIDNLIISLDGPEVPIMDGSSKAFIFMFECAGLKFFDSKKRYLKILKEVQVNDGDAYINVSPDSNFSINMKISFENKAIGEQHLSWSSPQSSFKPDLSTARTFGFVEEVNVLKKRGLVKGASLENAIGISGTKILNPEGLRFKDEFVRHKILDAIGDLSISKASSIYGTFNCYKSGHLLNNQILHAILSDSKNYQWVS